MSSSSMGNQLAHSSSKLHGREASLLDLPHELLLFIAQQLPQEDRVRLSGVSRQTLQLSLHPELWRSSELLLDFNTARWLHLCEWRMQQQQEGLRLWVLKRRASIRSLRIRWPGSAGYDFDRHTMIAVSQLVCSLVGSLDSYLQRLEHQFSCYAWWSNALVPMCAGALRHLSIEECHLPRFPDMLSTLNGLTSLSISLCSGYAETQEGLPQLEHISKLTSLEELTLRECIMMTAPSGLAALTRLTWLDLEGNLLPEFEGLPQAWSGLERLACLDLSSCNLVHVPEVIQHFTALRTLLLGSNDITEAEEDEEGAPVEEHPQGVPLALSALRQLECLQLEGNYVGTMPKAFTGLTGLTRLSLRRTDLGAEPLLRGPYLSALQELDLDHNGNLDAASFESALAAAPRLRRLLLHGCNSLREVPRAVQALGQLTCLDVSKTNISSFPAGPYAASLQQLYARGCPAGRAARLPLPALPQLLRLDWSDNARLSLAAVRTLLAQAPHLKDLLLVDPARDTTPPARKELEQAGVVLDTTSDRFCLYF